MNKLTTISLLALLALLAMTVTSCNPINAPEGSPDDVGRFTDGLVRFTETVNPGAEETTRQRLEPAEQFAERVYYDCQQTSASAGQDTGVRKPFGKCPVWDSDTLGPATPTSCEEALCAALLSECVAENLYAISHEVQDFESSAYPDPGTARDLQFTAPPQLAAAKATLVEVASTWAARSIQISGENLRQAFAVPPRSGVTYQASCEPGTRAPNGLFNSRHILHDVLGNGDVNSSWAEAFLSTLAHVSDLQTTLASGIEQTFSAVAESERSRNTSATVAARFAWVEGRTSRARAAHALIGGNREGGLFRVPDGYGSLGRLNSTERQALGDIRAAGINPAVLSHTGEQIVDAVVAAINSHPTDSGDPVGYTRADLLDNRGLTEGDFLRAARSLDDAITVFGMNRALLLPASPETPDRFAATSSFEVVPPSLDLLAGARRGTLAGTTRRSSRSRMLDAAYALDSTAASLDYAADVMDELAPQIGGAGVPADLRTVLDEVFGAAAGSVLGQRTGRAEFCSHPGFSDFFGQGQGGTVRYAGEAQHPVAVRGLDGLRCALTGTIHGASCDVQTWLLPPGPVMNDHTAGEDAVHTWTAPSTTAAVYILDEQRDDGDAVAAYHSIAGRALT